MNIEYEFTLQQLPSIASRDKIRLAKRYYLGYVTYQHRLARMSPMEEKFVNDKHTYTDLTSLAGP